MKQKYILPPLIIACGFFSALSSIRYDLNHFRAGDHYTRQEMEYVQPGDTGINVLWNFQQLDVINEKHPVYTFLKTREDTCRFVVMEHLTRYHYLYREDTLWLTGFENKTVKMDFFGHEARLRFPFHYGDSLCSPFYGTGIYCQKIPLVAKGRTSVKADATGTLITPENDTLHHVIRVKQQRSYTETGHDSVNLKMETYSWYARGYRYPIFETVTITERHIDSTEVGFKNSFYYPLPDMELIPEDILNEQLRQEDVPADSTEQVILNCVTFPNPVRNTLGIRYYLSKEVSVSYRICDMNGFPVIFLSEGRLSQGDHQHIISMSQCLPGDYILYILVDQKVFTKTIIKQ